MNVLFQNPATLEISGQAPACSPEIVLHAVEEAQGAHPAWARLSYKERGGFLLRVRRLILDQIDEIAAIISRNNGKPLVEAISSDLLPICDLLSYFAAHTEKLLRPEKIPIGVMGLLGRRSKIYYEPLGVIGIISPWNFPFSIPMSGTVMALMTGNCVLLKPADATAAVGYKIEELFRQAGLPKGVFAHLPGGASVGETLINAPIDKIIFTGSVRVGKHVMETCAKRLTPCVLELGGKDPMIVCHDADLENAAQGAVWGGFCNAGQVCASVERVYVDERIAEEFTRRVIQKTEQLKQGLGTEHEVDVGPLTTENQFKIVQEQVEEAKQRGAKIWIGGEVNLKFPGYFYKPTVITGVDHSFQCVREETFGPVLPIMTFKTEEQAIELANDSPYGLTASVWTKNLKRGRKIAKKIRAGTVSINDCTYTYAISQTPWGGLKSSGFGRTHGKIGLHEMVHLKHIHENHLPRIPDFWWFGYDHKLYETLKILSKDLTGNLWQKARGVARILQETMRKKYE